MINLIIRIFVFLIALCLCITPCVRADISQDGFYDYSGITQKVLPLSYAGDDVLSQSIQTLYSLIKSNPLDGDLYIALAQNYLQKNEIDKALDCLNHAIDSKIETSPIYAYIGDVYFFTSAYEKAVHFYKQAVSLDYLNYENHLKLGHAYLHVSDFANALASYKKSVEINPFCSDAYYACGIIALYQNKYEYARNLFIQVIAFNDIHIQSLNNLGVLLQQDKNEWDAIAYFQKTIHINPNYEIGLINLARSLLRKGKVAIARQYLERALSLNNRRDKTYYLLGMIYEQTNELLKAIEMFLYLSESDPSNENYLYILARLYAERKDFIQAERCYLKLIELFGSTRYYLIDYALLLVEMERYDDAVKSFNNLLMSDHADFRAHFLLSKLYLKQLHFPLFIHHLIKSGNYLYSSITIVFLVLVFVFVLFLSVKVFFQLYS
jgi:tetratricopeptide (TPR) repeat protein